MAQKANPKRKEKYARQKDITTANKKKKLLKHLKEQPNDLQAKGAL